VIAVALLSLMIDLGALSLRCRVVGCWLLRLAASGVLCDDISVVSISSSKIGGSDVKQTCFEVPSPDAGQRWKFVARGSKVRGSGDGSDRSPPVKQDEEVSIQCTVGVRCFTNLETSKSKLDNTLYNGII